MDLWSEKWEEVRSFDGTLSELVQKILDELNLAGHIDPKTIRSKNTLCALIECHRAGSNGGRFPITRERNPVNTTAYERGMEEKGKEAIQKRKKEIDSSVAIPNYSSKSKDYVQGVLAALEGRTLTDALRYCSGPMRDRIKEGYIEALKIVIPHGETLVELDDLIRKVADKEINSFKEFFDYITEKDNLKNLKRYIRESEFKGLHLFTYSFAGSLSRPSVRIIVQLDSHGNLIALQSLNYFGTEERLGFQHEQGESCSICKQDGEYRCKLIEQTDQFLLNMPLDRPDINPRSVAPKYRQQLIDLLSKVRKTLFYELTKGCKIDIQAYDIRSDISSMAF